MDEIQSFTQSNSTDFPMMSEQEAQHMIQVYNETIKMLTKENDLLNTKLTTLKISHLDVSRKNQDILDLIEVEQIRATTLANREEDINFDLAAVLKDPMLLAFKSQVEDELLPHRIRTIQDEQIIQFDQINDEQILQECDEPEPLLQRVIDVILEIARIRKQQSAPKNCIQCHAQYNPQTNKHESCLYHPGKLKFYSCKKCGTDEYYTCCLRCRKCSEGCRTGFHSPKQ